MVLAFVLVLVCRLFLFAMIDVFHNSFSFLIYYKDSTES